MKPRIRNRRANCGPLRLRLVLSEQRMRRGHTLVYSTSLRLLQREAVCVKLQPRYMRSACSEKVTP